MLCGVSQFNTSSLEEKISDCVSHLPLNSFSFALISILAQLQFATFLLDLSLIHHLISLLFCICTCVKCTNLTSIASHAQNLYYQNFLIGPIVVLVYLFLHSPIMSQQYFSPLAINLGDTIMIYFTTLSPIFRLGLFHFLYQFLNTNVFLLYIFGFCSPLVLQTVRNSWAWLSALAMSQMKAISLQKCLKVFVSNGISSGPGEMKKHIQQCIPFDIWFPFIKDTIFSESLKPGLSTQTETASKSWSIRYVSEPWMLPDLIKAWDYSICWAFKINLRILETVWVNSWWLFQTKIIHYDKCKLRMS